MSNVVLPRHEFSDAVRTRCSVTSPHTTDGMSHFLRPSPCQARCGCFVARFMYTFLLNAVLLNVLAISIRSSRKIRHDYRSFLLHQVPRLLAISVSALRESMKHFPCAESRTHNIGLLSVMPSSCLSVVNVICRIYVLDDHLRPLLVFTS